MDILNWVVRVQIFLLSLFTVNQGYSQDTEKVIDAFRTSYSFEQTGDLSKAGEALKMVYDENSYEINLRLGWLTYLAGSFFESITYYNRAISNMPYAIEPRLGVVYPLSSLGNWDQVIEQYKRILTTDPNNTYANYHLGLIYYNREDFVLANQYVEKLVNLYPFDVDGLILLGWVKLSLRQFRESKILFQRALMNSPDNILALEGLSILN